jgi:hypothetical protein
MERMDEEHGQIRIGRRCFRSIWNVDPMSISFAKISSHVFKHGLVVVMLDSEAADIFGVTQTSEFYDCQDISNA